MYLCIHLFIYSFVHLFIYLFIRLYEWMNVLEIVWRIFTQEK